MSLHVGDESLVTLLDERGKIVRDIACEQHIAFGASHEITRVTRAVAWRRQANDRSIFGYGKAAGEAMHGGAAEVEHRRRESAWHRRRQGPHQRPGKTRHRFPFRARHPHTPTVERAEPADVI